MKKRVTTTSTQILAPNRPSPFPVKMITNMGDKKVYFMKEGHLTLVLYPGASLYLNEERNAKTENGEGLLSIT